MKALKMNKKSHNLNFNNPEIIETVKIVFYEINKNRFHPNSENWRRNFMIVILNWRWKWKMKADKVTVEAKLNDKYLFIKILHLDPQMHINKSLHIEKNLFLK